MSRTQPQQKPGRSKQSYRTPPAFLYAVQAAFGTIAIDLAADGPNVCERWFGPGSPIGDDAFAKNWFTQIPMGGRHIGWLNPPFGSIAAWAQKCVEESRAHGCKIVLLTPSSLGADWYCDIVQPHALTLVVRPRLVFVDESTPYPKDLAIHVFGSQMVGLGTWRWQQSSRGNGRKEGGR